MNFKHVYLYGFFVTLGIITYRDLRDCEELPFPARFSATGVVFLLTNFASSIVGPVAPLVLIGVILALWLNHRFPECDAQKAAGTAQPAEYKTVPNAPGDGQPATSAASPGAGSSTDLTRSDLPNYMGPLPATTTGQATRSQLPNYMGPLPATSTPSTTTPATTQKKSQSTWSSIVSQINDYLTGKTPKGGFLP